MNENYTHPEMPAGSAAGILKGMYRLSTATAGKKDLRVQLLGSGTILREAMAAAEMLAKDWDVGADVWSCPSFTELRRDGIATDRWNILHPESKPRASYVEQCLKGQPGPVIAATDYMRTLAEGIRPWVSSRYQVLGTDGFGRSDTREQLRKFFEVDRYYITVAALKALTDDDKVPSKSVTQAIKKYKIDPEKPAPWTV